MMFFIVLAIGMLFLYIWMDSVENRINKTTEELREFNDLLDEELKKLNEAFKG
jgi:hypothetical protein